MWSGHLSDVQQLQEKGSDDIVPVIQLYLCCPSDKNQCASLTQTGLTGPIPPHSVADAFTDSAISAKVNGEHKEKDLEPWDGGENTASEELEALETDVVSAAFYHLWPSVENELFHWTCLEIIP